MNLLRKYAIFCSLIISILGATNLNAKQLDKLVSFADQQFELGNYKLAAMEYNRAIFFGDDRQDLLYLKIAESYFHLQNYPLSLAFFDKSYYASSADSIQSEAILGKSFCFILKDQYMLALAELMNLKDSLPVNQEIKASFYTGLAYFGTTDYPKAEAAFSSCLTTMNKKADVGLINQEFETISKSRKRYNPTTAWFLSLIIPGSGQLYSGEIKEAANSMVLLGGLIYITIRLSVNYSFFEAAITVLPWFQRYYIGGANRAERYAEETYQHKRYNAYLRILQQIDND